MVLDHMAITPFPVLYKCCNVLNKQRRPRSPAQLIKESKESNTLIVLIFLLIGEVPMHPFSKKVRQTASSPIRRRKGEEDVEDVDTSLTEEAPGRRCQQGMATDPQGGKAPGRRGPREAKPRGGEAPGKQGPWVAIRTGDPQVGRIHSGETLYAFQVCD